VTLQSHENLPGLGARTKKKRVAVKGGHANGVNALLCLREKGERKSKRSPDWQIRKEGGCTGEHVKPRTKTVDKKEDRSDEKKRKVFTP